MVRKDNLKMLIKKLKKEVDCVNEKLPFGVGALNTGYKHSRKKNHVDNDDEILYYKMPDKIRRG